jgi:vacuolar-type H+-ATPase subunit H
MVDTEKAVEYYQKHLQRLKAYNEQHKDKIRESARANFQKIKADPEKYALYKEKKRLKYKSKTADKENTESS